MNDPRTVTEKANAFRFQLDAVRHLLGVEQDEEIVPAIGALQAHVASSVERFKTVEEQNRALTGTANSLRENFVLLQRENEKLGIHARKLEDSVTYSAMERERLAQEIRDLPFVPGTVVGRRQEWMRESAARLVEGKDPLLPPVLPEPPPDFSLPPQLVDALAVAEGALAGDDEPSGAILKFPRAPGPAVTKAGEIVWYCAEFDQALHPAMVTDFLVGTGETRLEVFGLADDHEERRPLAKRGEGFNCVRAWYPRR